MWLALRKLGAGYKKSLSPPKANADKRRILQTKIEAYEREGRSITYVDESGFTKDMPRTHGYALKGQRCYGTHNW